jgi:mannose-1-phosphate guanylyltransferase
MEHYYSVILAGGVGKRFWPLSRKKRPKQLLDIVGSKSMINLTIDRLRKLGPLDHIYIMTNREQMGLIMAQNKELQPENFIIEPSGKNTAPAIGLAAHHLLHRDPHAVMGVFPADHLIHNQQNFASTVQSAIDSACKHRALFTFGIQPSYPATGYGYIQVEKDELPDEKNIYRVKTFAEKPNTETAKMFMKSGEFLWNSGMFVWQAKLIIEKINRYLPETGQVLADIAKKLGSDEYKTTVARLWKTIKPISIDYGILEQSTCINVIRARFDWSDVGSWDTVYKIENKDKNRNVMRAKGLLLRSGGNYVYAKNAKIFGLGIKNMIIVENDGVLLILPRSESENIKELVDSLPLIGEQDLL